MYNEERVKQLVRELKELLDKQPETYDEIDWPGVGSLDADHTDIGLDALIEACREFDEYH